MEVWLTLVGEYGFPIVVTFSLLYRIEKKLDQLNQSVMHLGKLVQFGAHIVPASAPKAESADWRMQEVKQRNL
ncbi:YvrJ family protein [Evansella sp. AB-rgal1]|uniref:YvrJ family protein n=1 Tax=Evansella sp. AB-rgal1 TaxID=3242696 RepID=UPI00359DDD86